MSKYHIVGNHMSRLKSSDFSSSYLIILFQCAVDHIAVDSDEARKCLNEGQFLYCFLEQD